ncbi:hypothetical protein Q4S18_19425, partial [Morganella morganii]
SKIKQKNYVLKNKISRSFLNVHKQNITNSHWYADDFLNGYCFFRGYLVTGLLFYTELFICYRDILAGLFQKNVTFP